MNLITFHSQFAGGLDSSATDRVVQFRDNRISGVRNNSAEDTSNITGGKGDNQLFRFGAVSSWFWNDVFVKSFNGTLEASEFHHGVWDLTHPEWWQSFVESEVKRKFEIKQT